MLGMVSDLTKRGFEFETRDGVCGAKVVSAVNSERQRLCTGCEPSGFFLLCSVDTQLLLTFGVNGTRFSTPSFDPSQNHSVPSYLVAGTHSDASGGSADGERANVTRLVFGRIEADFSNYILSGKLSPRSTLRFTALNFCSSCCRVAQLKAARLAARRPFVNLFSAVSRNEKICKMSR